VVAGVLACRLCLSDAGLAGVATLVKHSIGWMLILMGVLALLLLFYVSLY
jgi:hypothetical protein